MFWREPPTHVLRPRYSIPTIWILISSLPKLLSTQIFFPPNPNLWERVECWETFIWITRARSSSSTHHLLPFGEWCLLDWLGVTWEPLSRLWSWTKEFVRARRSPTSWRSTLVRQVLHGRWPWWDKQGCFFMDPSWVEPSVDSCNRYPSWVEISMSTLRLLPPNSSLYLHMQCFTFRCYTVRLACVGWLLDLF